MMTKTDYYDAADLAKATSALMEKIKKTGANEPVKCCVLSREIDREKSMFLKDAPEGDIECTLFARYHGNDANYMFSYSWSQQPMMTVKLEKVA